MLNASTSRNRKSGDSHDVPGVPFISTRYPDAFVRFSKTAPEPSDFDVARTERDNLGFPGIPQIPDSGSKNPQGNDDCLRTQSLLSAYLDRELDTPTINRVETHLETCPNCSAMEISLLNLDEQLKWEWQRDLPLPSSSLSLKERASIDSILSALPPETVTVPDFAPRRIHARARWMRFSAGIAALIALLGFCLHRIG